MDLQTVIDSESLIAGDILIHDPSRVLYHDGYYYMYSTGHGVRMRRSTDLLHWKLIGSVFAELPDWCSQAVPGKNESSLWAPDIIYFNNLYHLYYSVSTWGSNVSAIGLATNPVLDPANPDYCWIDCGPVIISSDTDFNAIDPCPIFELPPSPFQGEGWGEVNPSSDSPSLARRGLGGGYDSLARRGPGGGSSGNLWLVFGSFFSGIKLIKLDSATGTRMPGDTHILTLASRPGIEHNPIEAPYLIHFGGYYYLFTNWDFCCRGADSTYNIRVARSREITGPYLDKDGVDTNHGGGSLFLTTQGDSIGPGQFGFIDDPLNHHELRFVYHYYDRSNNGRSTLGISRLRLDPDGWPVVI